MIAITLIHNRPENSSQIAALKAMLTEIREPVLDARGRPFTNPDGSPQTTHVRYELRGETVRVYQIIPFQPENKSDPYEAVRPEGFDDLVSYNVMYGKGDEDKIGDHPRFYNWALKRAGDHGSRVVVMLDDYTKIDGDQIDALVKGSEDFVQTDAVRVSKIGRVSQLPEVRRG